MTKDAHNDFSIVNEFFHLTFFFLCDVSWRRIIAIFYIIAVCHYCKIAEPIL